MAFIVDIRRGNMLELLLYKALFEISNDRAEFLSRLFSRPMPAALPRSAALPHLKLLRPIRFTLSLPRRSWSFFRYRRLMS
jgi:hypothetical protein